MERNLLSHSDMEKCRERRKMLEYHFKNVIIKYEDIINTATETSQINLLTFDAIVSTSHPLG